MKIIREVFPVILTLFFGFVAWYDVPPPKESTNIIYQLLQIEVSVFWLPFVALAIFIITRWFLRRNKKAPGPSDATSNKVDLEKVIQDEIDIDIRPGEKQIYITKNTADTPMLRIWLMLINKSDFEIILERIKWELWIGQPVKKNEDSFGFKIKPKETHKAILIEVSLSETEVADFKEKYVQDVGIRQLTGSAFLYVEDKPIKKLFCLDGINYSLDENITAKKVHPCEEAKSRILAELREIYGRLIGLRNSLPQHNFMAGIAKDFNNIVDEVDNLVNNDMKKYKIPESAFMRSGYCRHEVGASRISQFISSLEYTYGFKE